MNCQFNVNNLCQNGDARRVFCNDNDPCKFNPNSSKISNSSNSQEKADSSLLTDEKVKREVAIILFNTVANLQQTLEWKEHEEYFKSGVTGYEEEAEAILKIVVPLAFAAGEKKQAEKDRAENERLKTENKYLIKAVEDGQKKSVKALLEARKAGARELAESLNVKHWETLLNGAFSADPALSEDSMKLLRDLLSEVQSKLKSLEAK